MSPVVAPDGTAGLTAVTAALALEAVPAVRIAMVTGRYPPLRLPCRR